MKKYNFLSIILFTSLFIITMSLFCPEGEPAGAEVGKDWKKPEPTTKEGIDELRDESQDELQKSTEEWEEAKTDEEKDAAQIEIKKAQYNVKTADIAQSKREIDPSLPEYKEGIEEYINKKIQQAQEFQKQLEQEIQQLSEQLVSTFEAPVQEQEKFSVDQIISDLDKITQADKIDQIRLSFITSFQELEIKEEIKNAKSSDDKLKIIGDLRKKIARIDEKVGEKLTDAKQDYKNSLEKFKDRIRDRLTFLDEQAIKLDAQKLGFFDKFKNWLDRTFDIHKKATEKRIVTDSEIFSAKDKYDNFIEKSEKLFNNVERIIGDAEKDIKRMNEIKKLRDPGDLLDEQLMSMEELAKSIDEFEKKAQEEKEQYEETFKDLRDVYAKSERYRGKKYEDQTLFEKMRDDFNKVVDPKQLKVEPAGDRAPFKANELYEALGLSQKDAAKITAEQIKNAYEKKIEGLDKDSYEYKVARNAVDILHNPTSKVSYDAFLKDWNTLKRLNIDPTGVLTKPAQKNLNESGELAKLEIKKPTHTKIFLGTFFEGEEKIKYTYTADRFKKLSEIKKKLDESIKAAQKVQKEGIPSAPPV